MHTQIQSEKRQYGLDVLRILSMLGVVCLHMLSYGGIEQVCAADPAKNAAVTAIRVCSYPAVDCFVLLSGYFLCTKRFRLSRLVRLWLQAAFWSVLIQCVFFVVDSQSVSAGKVVYMFLPIISGRYWFLNAYVAMSLFTPFLNRLIHGLDRFSYRCGLLAIGFVFSLASVLARGNDVFGAYNGYHFSWYVALYMVGGYLRRFCSGKYRPRQLWICLAVLNCIQFAYIFGCRFLSAWIPEVGGYEGLLLKYTSPLVVGSAVCLLLLFEQAQGNYKWAARCAPFTFAVYLIHEHPLIRDALIQNGFAWIGKLNWAGVVVTVGVCAAAILAVCIILDWGRSRLFAFTGIDRRCDRACRSFSAFLEKVLKGQDKDGY